jgi:formylglycine-generating enzyme required for sulfatase activity
MTFAWIPPGSFLMGSPSDEVEREYDETQHTVTLSRGFWLDIHPVTQARWQLAMGGNPSHFKGDDLPVETISWDDAVTFCQALRQKDGQPYRLPTEAEWEYACRAGTTTPFHFGATISTDQANYDGNYPYDEGDVATRVYRRTTTPVGSFPANAWGLFDMHGNVYEWCADWASSYETGEITDPQGGDIGETRILRGGSWIDVPWRCRAAHRGWAAPGDRHWLLGCRVAPSLG